MAEKVSQFNLTLYPFNQYIQLEVSYYMVSIRGLFLCNLPISYSQPNPFKEIKNIIKQYKNNGNCLQFS